MSALPSSETEIVGASDARETVMLEWTVHLVRRDPTGARVVIAAMILSSLLGVWLFHSALFIAVGPLLLVSATAEYLFPIHYRLTDRRAFAANGAARLEIAWDRVKRIDSHTGSSKLSPFALPNRLDNFRGVILRYAEAGETGDRAQVLAVVAQYSNVGTESNAAAKDSAMPEVVR